MIQQSKAMFLLVKRALTIFIKDKMNVFFSLLAPMIVLVLYVLFLRDVQLDSIKSGFEGLNVDSSIIAAVVDSWMIAGVMGVSAVTVSFSANTIMVQDRDRHIDADISASPVPKSTITLSYFIGNVVITAVITTFVLVVSLIYLAATGWNLTGTDILGILATLVLSIFSAAALSVFVSSFVKTESALGGLIGILSAAIGFLCGAYMPISIFPRAIQYVTLFIPPTYSAGLFRNFFMQAALDKMSVVSAEGAAEIAKTFSLNLDFFGFKLGIGGQFSVLAVSILIFVALNVMKSLLRDQKGKRA